MATKNKIDVGLSGSSGSGSFAGTTSPVFTTPTLGAATATTVVFSPTTGGIIGTTTNDNANAGNVGQSITSVIAAASGVSLTNNIAANVTSISLTAGDWDVTGNIGFPGNGATSIGQTRVWSSITSATSPDLSLYNGESVTVTSPAASIGHSIPSIRYSLSGTTTVYLSCLVEFSGGTQVACGGIYARRAR